MMKTEKPRLRFDDYYGGFKVNIPDHELEVLKRFIWSTVKDNLSRGQKLPRINIFLSITKQFIWRIGHVTRTIDRSGERFKTTVSITCANNYPKTYTSRSTHEKVELRSQREVFIKAVAYAIEWVMAEDKVERKLHVELASQDVLDAYRRASFEIDEQIEHAKLEQMVREENKRQRQEQKQARAKDPMKKAEKELSLTEQKIKKWERLRKLAETKVAKYKKRKMALNRKLAKMKEQLNHEHDTRQTSEAHAAAAATAR